LLEGDNPEILVMMPHQEPAGQARSQQGGQKGRLRLKPRCI